MSTWVTYTSACRRRSISEAEAVSTNSVSASARLSRIRSQWTGTSSGVAWSWTASSAPIQAGKLKYNPIGQTICS